MAATNEMTHDEVQRLLAENRADEQTQEARLRAARGKRMLFVGGDFMYKSFAPSLQRLMKRVRDMGVVVYAVFQSGTEEPTKYFLDAKNGECFDYELFADVGAEDGAENIVAALAAVGWTGELDAVYSMHEATQPIVAKVQALLGLPGNDVAAYEKARDKYETRRCLEQNGLNTIKAMQIWRVEDADEAAVRIGFPMIIKPTVGMGSSGVYRCNNLQELNVALERLFDDIKTDWTLNRNTIGRQAPVLAETFVLPTIFAGRINEHDCEVLLWDGEVVYANIIDNFTTRPPYFQEVASLMPTLMSDEDAQAMKDYAVACVKAMGFTRGGFHVECWHTNEGPLLIEVNPRVGGGATVESHENVWGVNPMFEMLLSMLDIPINPPRASAPLCNYGYCLPNADITGHLEPKISYLDTAKDLPMHKSSTYFKKGGDFVKGNDKYIADWLGEVHLAHSVDKLDELLTTMDKLLLDVSTSAARQTAVPDMPQEE